MFLKEDTVIWLSYIAKINLKLAKILKHFCYSNYGELYVSLDKFSNWTEISVLLENFFLNVLAKFSLIISPLLSAVLLPYWFKG